MLINLEIWLNPLLLNKLEAGNYNYIFVNIINIKLVNDCINCKNKS